MLGDNEQKIFLRILRVLQDLNILEDLEKIKK